MVKLSADDARDLLEYLEEIDDFDPASGLEGPQVMKRAVEALKEQLDVEVN